MYSNKKIELASEKCSETKKLLYKKGILKIWNKGIPRSEDWKKKISETRKKLFKEGKLKNSFEGKQHTDKVKNLRSKQDDLKFEIHQENLHWYPTTYHCCLFLPDFRKHQCSI